MRAALLGIATLLVIRALGEEMMVPALGADERARLAKAIAVIEAKGTNIMPHSNLGILLSDASHKERDIGGRAASTIPIYERVARTLTNAAGQGSATNGGR